MPLRRVLSFWFIAKLHLADVNIFLQFPERWFRGTFDIFGASHQWLHIMVIAAGLTHTFGVLQAFDYLHNQPAECS